MKIEIQASFGTPSEFYTVLGMIKENIMSNPSETSWESTLMYYGEPIAQASAVVVKEESELKGEG